MSDPIKDFVEIIVKINVKDFANAIRHKQIQQKNKK